LLSHFADEETEVGVSSSQDHSARQRGADWLASDSGSLVILLIAFRDPGAQMLGTGVLRSEKVRARTLALSPAGIPCIYLLTASLATVSHFLFVCLFVGWLVGWLAYSQGPVYLRLALNLLRGSDGWFYLSTCHSLESLKKEASSQQPCRSDWPVGMSAGDSLDCQRPTLNVSRTTSWAGP